MNATTTSPLAEALYQAKVAGLIPFFSQETTPMAAPVNVAIRPTPQEIAQLYDRVATMTPEEFAAAMVAVARVRQVKLTGHMIGMAGKVTREKLLRFISDRRGGYLRSKLTEPAGRVITPLIENE